MPTLTVTVDETIPTNGITFRAPKGLMYDIKHISSVIHEAGDNSFGVYVRAFEERLGPVLIEEIGPTTDLIFISDAFNVVTTVAMAYPEPERSKHITIVRGDNTSFLATVLINYSLTKVSTVDLIWDFLRRGKNP